jgi:4-hydroxybutyrate CoA-transferase
MSNPLSSLHLPSHSSVFIHSASAAPQELIRQFCARNTDRKNIRIHSLHTEGIAPWAKEKYRNIFSPQPFFVGDNVRDAIQRDHGSYLPASLSDTPDLFRKKILPIDLALISVSIPDKHGYYSMGPSADVSRAAVESASKVIAQINEELPRTFGDTLIHKSEINQFITHSEPLPTHDPTPISKEDKKISEIISELIPNGATIQVGIGRIPMAVLGKLIDHKDLGLHTEVVTDAILPLIEKGVITNRAKLYERNFSVCSFAIGTKELYENLNDNPSFRFLEFSKTNNHSIIACNPNMIAINSAIEIDLTGQVCADSFGPLIYSGAGGQSDFIRGAAASQGGKPIIAIRSTTNDGRSKIVSSLRTGAGVVTTRTDVQWVVTEYGAVNLLGKTLHERALLLTSIAHPNYRSLLWNTFESEYLLHS